MLEKALKQKQSKKAIDKLIGNDLKAQYEYCCNEYVKQFAAKQAVDFEGWVGFEIGGVACFNGQYFFNLSDIIIDINTKQKKGLIIKWQDESVEHASNGGYFDSMNYFSYTKGLRFDQLNKEPKETKEMPEIKAMKKDFESFLDSIEK